MDEGLENVLEGLRKQAEKILDEEIEKYKVIYDSREVRIWPIRSVGVQGDNRTYGHPIEVEIISDKKYVWENQEEFIRSFSTRMTNEIKVVYNGEDVLVNRVIYSLRES